MAADPHAGTVATSRHGRVLVVAMEREEKRNALDRGITAGIDAAMNELEDDPELWCGILTGTERVFSAGADLAAGPGGPTERGGLVGLIQRERSKPLIAAVEGFALGGGVELILCCDLVVASHTATFGLPEVKRGLMPDFGGAFRISRVLPANVAREMLLTGQSLTAERAERLGFVNMLTAPGGALTGALELAERICANAPQAVREALGLVTQEVNGDETASWERSHAAHARLLETEDVREGIAAFFERRDPRWTNG
jgi:enoyl-CoA hydratase/carnithine racemase